MEERCDEIAGTEAVAESLAGNRNPAKLVMADAKLNYLRLMTMTLLSELNSLHDNGSERSSVDLKTEVLQFESELIRSALCTTKGQQRRAARLLGTNATTLNTKLKRLKIDIDEPNLDDFVVSQSSEGRVDENGHHLTFADAMLRYEVSLIRNALVQTGGNQSKAARLLALPVTTLNSKIKKLKIEVPKYSADPALFTSAVDRSHAMR